METPGQFAFLEGEGCDEVQGYYFSRPIPAADLARLLVPGSAPALEAQRPAPVGAAGVSTGGRRPGRGRRGAGRHVDLPPHQALSDSMSAAAPTAEAIAAPRVPGLGFACGFAGIAILAAALAGAIPIEYSIATVFLFAGPHNWFEARYALGRLPARAGKLYGFFTLSALGIVGLTIAYAAIPFLIPHATSASHVGAMDITSPRPE